MEQGQGEEIRSGGIAGATLHSKATDQVSALWGLQP